MKGRALPSVHSHDPIGSSFGGTGLEFTAVAVVAVDMPSTFDAPLTGVNSMGLPLVAMSRDSAVPSRSFTFQFGVNHM